MPKRYYIAYGSNLSTKQMFWRCPSARLVGTTRLTGWRLRFRRSMTGFYATIERDDDSYVPAAVYEVSEADERQLDRYEGFPHCYDKRELTVTVKGIVSGRNRHRRAFAYVLDTDRHIGPPTLAYFMTCLGGYQYFGFPMTVLAEAYDEAREVRK